MTRPLATAKLSDAEAELCSDSGSMKTRVSPHRLTPPFDTTALYFSPRIEEDVMGKVQAPWLMCFSTQIAASPPSPTSGKPGNGNSPGRPAICILALSAAVSPGLQGA